MRNGLALVFALSLVAACTQRETEQQVPAETTATSPETAVSVRAEGDVGPDLTPEEIEKVRFDNAWRQLASFRDGSQASQNPSPSGTVPEAVKFAPPGMAAEADALNRINPEQIDQLPVRAPLSGDVQGASVLRAQTLLDRVGFSPGILDGRWGKNTEVAVWWFQRSAGIQPTGTIDQQTWNALVSRAGTAPTLARQTLKAQDLEGPFAEVPDDVYEQAKLDCMCYENVGEKLGEMFHSTPELLSTINGGADLSKLKAGDRIWVPAVGSSDSRPVQSIRISVKGNYFHGLDGQGNVIFHAPTTLGSKFDPSPTETLKIVGIAQDPDFHYQPKLFHEVDDSEEEALLPPGPNSPVGVVWMALSKPHYGIHGTSNPSSIGYATSHGCIRLTNWDAKNISKRVQQGTKVEFVDTRSSG